tara:strand:+ start:232 stop:513 length:282 start_codon:yes stop_codon:yes gene_type:complete
MFAETLIVSVDDKGFVLSLGNPADRAEFFADGFTVADATAALKNLANALVGDLEAVYFSSTVDFPEDVGAPTNVDLRSVFNSAFDVLFSAEVS